MMEQRKKNLVLKMILGVVTLILGCSPLVLAQKSSNSSGSSSGNMAARTPLLHATFLNQPNQITIDGKLNEAIWQQAEMATGFIQRAPHDGKPATEPTEARILYTEHAIYIAAKAYDSAIDSIAATLFRRDGSAYSDWFLVGIDSYNDDKTSFTFGVNPLGVRKDLLISNDSDEDDRWDAVWTAKTQIQDDGWTVEMEIPLSQLRYSTNRNRQTWGINFQRLIARKDESSFWAPIPQNASGIVSKFGELEGIHDLDRPKRLELLPYISASVTRAPMERANPYYNRNALFGSVGADVKYGLTSDLTLTATINPDFGQVEADPAQINLSAYETYFDEQRKFFLEGNDIFQFGRTSTFSVFGNPITFYSRRIGRAPQGDVDLAGIDAEFVDQPDYTTIASAVKLSGKTENGLSVGVLNALTVREKSTFQRADGSTGTVTVEPPTNYFVGRLKQDFNEGVTVVGLFGGAVNRFIETPYLKDELHHNSYIAGLDFEQSWNSREWILSGSLSGTSVNGSVDKLLQTQQSSTHYFNRPDADYVTLDSSRTNLSGIAGEFSFARFGGEHLRGSVSYSVVTPGYDVSDIGYQQRVDYQGVAYFLQYRNTDVWGPFRYADIGLNKFHSWNFGEDKTNNGYDLISSAQFTNLWRVNLRTGLRLETYNERLLRGGPKAKNPRSQYISLVLQSDPSKKAAFSVGHLREGNELGGFGRDYFINLTLRPTSFIQVELHPNYNIQHNKRQYVTTVTDPLATATYGSRYVFANIDRTTFSTSLRLDWTFTPEISLQTYLRPFITSGNYYDYKEFSTPGTYEFAVYGKEKGTLTKQNDVYHVDPDAEGQAQPFSFSDRDFNYRAVQSNFVFRWEYQPGSVLYVVWQHERNSQENIGQFHLNHDMNELFAADPTNVLLVKFSYWFGS
jgi:hypothetical protein